MQVPTVLTPSCLVAKATSVEQDQRTVTWGQSCLWEQCRGQGVDAPQIKRLAEYQLV